MLLLSACTQVYDLDETAIAPPDRDGDRVRDDDDTCVDLPNAGDAQLDTDGDGLGDVCDVCPAFASANQHDEDRDRLGDECDPCPAVRDFGDDSDGDGVGDLCEPDVAITARRLFDPFTSIAPRYTIPGMPWVSSGDAATPTGELSSTDTGIEARDVLLTSGAWFVSMGLHSEARWNTERHGLVLRDSTGARRFGCAVRCTTGSCSVYFGADNDSISVTTASLLPDVVLTFNYRVTSATTAQMSCTVTPSAFAPTIVPTVPVEEAVWPSFYTQPTTELRYVEVIE